MKVREFVDDVTSVAIWPASVLALHFDPLVAGFQDSLSRCSHILWLGLCLMPWALLVAAVMHELGHFVAAWIVGDTARPYGGGVGLLFCRLECAKIEGRWTVRRGLPVPHVKIPRTLDANPLDLRLVAGSGPLASALAALLLIVTLHGFYAAALASALGILAGLKAHPFWILRGMPPSLGTVYLIDLLLANLLLVANVLPLRGAGGATDGWILLHGRR